MFTHLSQQTPYTDEQIKTLARYPLITIEKYMGPFPLSGGNAEEDNIAAVAGAVKRINANSKVLMYLNSLFAYPFYRLYQLAERNKWWVLNQTTQKPYMHNVINLNCTMQKFKHCPEVSVGYWQFAQPELQAAWIATCTETRSIDGCFIDGATSAPPYGGGDNISAYEAGRSKVFSAIAQKALVVVNDKQYYDPAPPYPRVQGEFIETFSGSEIKWMQILNRTQDGHLVQAHTGTSKLGSICHPAKVASQKSNEGSNEGIKDLAAFLIVAKEYSYFGCSNWQDIPTWPDVYDRPLGKPLGPAVLGADGTWTRRFARGTNCSINFGTGKAQIDWASSAGRV